jgi:UDP-N-acetyl-D-galactosamine dehydrogenase
VALTAWDQLPAAQAIVTAVAHNAYGEMGLKALTGRLVPGGVFVDVKSTYAPTEIEALGFKGWRL